MRGRPVACQSVSVFRVSAFRGGASGPAWALLRHAQVYANLPANRCMRDNRDFRAHGIISWSERETISLKEYHVVPVLRLATRRSYDST